jgi:hypothetical protein
MSGLALVTATIFALAPMAGRLRVRSAIANVTTRRGGRSARAARLSAMLVVTQTIFATVVVVATAFLIRTFAELQSVDLGFAPASVLTLRLTRMPQQAPADEIAGGVTPGYFDAIGTRLVAGRLFDAHDLRGTRPVAVVDEGFARTLSADGRVVGRLIRWFRQPDVDLEIVGVVRSVHHRDVSAPVVTAVYRPHTQYTRPSMYLAVKARSDAMRAAAAVSSAIHDIDPTSRWRMCRRWMSGSSDP